MIKEIWKDIPEYEGLYQISNFGRIKSKIKVGKDKKGRNYYKKEIICKPSIDTSGYKQIVLTKNGKRKSHKVHRLVAKTFIININNFEQVNHKDENKLNNRVDNLEWCTQIYNCNYGTRNYRCTKHMNKKVKQYGIENNFIKEYQSLKEAEEFTGIKYQQISGCCRNKYKTAGGYIWKYC